MQILSWLLLLLHAARVLSTPELTDRNFDAEIHGKTAFLKLFAPWCGHCKEMAPAWELLADELPQILVASVDCTKPESSNSCAAMEITGYPALRLIENNVVYEYDGPRDLNSLRTWATVDYKSTPSKPLRSVAPPVEDDRYVTYVTDGNLSQVEKTEKVVMLEFFAPWCSHCKDLAPAYNQLGAVVAESYPELLAVKCDISASPDAVKRYKLKGLPTIFVLKAGQVYEFQGARDTYSLLYFMLDPTGDSFPIPPPWTLWEDVKVSFQAAWEEVVGLLSRRQTASILIFLSGVASGCLLVLILSLIIARFKRRRASLAAAGAPAAETSGSKKEN